MKKVLMVSVVLGVALAIQVQAVEKSEKSFGKADKGGDVAPMSVTPLVGSTMNVSTNAKGDVTGATLQSAGGSSYIIVTNGMTSMAIQDLVKFSGKLVDCKGEIVQVNNKNAVKIAGKITVNTKAEEAKKKMEEQQKAAAAAAKKKK